MCNFDRILFDSYQRLLLSKNVKYQPPPWTKVKSIQVKKLTFKLSIIPERFSKRRPITDFKNENTKKFYFTTIPDAEVISICDKYLSHFVDSKIVLNNCPVMPNHFMVVAGFQSKTPQYLTRESIKLAAHVLQISESKNTLLGFNSREASASIDHLHFHIVYPEEKLHAQYASTENLTASSNFPEGYSRIDHFIDNFHFALVDYDSVDEFSQSIHHVISVLQSMNIAHNLVLCKHEKERIRSVLFLRGLSDKKKDQEEYGISLGVLEMAGFIVCKDEDTCSQLMKENGQAIEDNFNRLKLDQETLNAIYNLLL